jgi:uncharacterized protein involved in type VI secretion and phage assembly
LPCTLLAVEHHATNNLGSQIAKLLDNTELEQGTYKNHFHAAPAAAAVVPRWQADPTSPGTQPALVVGLDGEVLTTDRDLRVKVQFPWQRGDSPLPGGLAHDDTSADTKGNAPGNETSGTWVRLAQPSAGANWGSSVVPRIGTEVSVAFIEADIDAPSSPASSTTAPTRRRTRPGSTPASTTPASSAASTAARSTTARPTSGSSTTRPGRCARAWRPASCRRKWAWGT